MNGQKQPGRLRRLEDKINEILGRLPAAGGPVAPVPAQPAQGAPAPPAQVPPAPAQQPGAPAPEPAQQTQIPPAPAPPQPPPAPAPAPPGKHWPDRSPAELLAISGPYEVSFTRYTLGSARIVAWQCHPYIVMTGTLRTLDGEWDGMYEGVLQIDVP